MRILLFGRTNQESFDWAQQYMPKYSMAEVVHVDDGDDRKVRGYEYFLAVLLSNFSGRTDAREMYDLIFSRPGVLVTVAQYYERKQL